MVRKILAGLIVIASIVIVISFFMPWAKVSLSVTGVSKKIADSYHLPDKAVEKLKEITHTISTFGDPEVRVTVPGYKIPGMVNNKTSKVAISLTEIMTKSTSDLGQKSYLVYLFPLLGIICGILALGGLKSKAGKKNRKLGKTLPLITNILTLQPDMCEWTTDALLKTNSRRVIYPPWGCCGVTRCDA